MVALVIFYVVSWEDLVVKRHLGRLRADPGYLRELVRVPDGTLERNALLVYLELTEGRRALLELYLEQES